MSWNYRIVKLKEWNTLYCTEVYYDKNDNPNGFFNPTSFNPIQADNLEELNLQLIKIKEALSKPILIINENDEIEQECN